MHYKTISGFCAWCLNQTQSVSLTLELNMHISALFYSLKSPTNLNNCAHRQMKDGCQTTRPNTFLTNGCMDGGWGFYDTIDHILQQLGENKAQSEMHLINKPWLLLFQQLISSTDTVCFPSNLCRMSDVSQSQSGRWWNTYQSVELREKHITNSITIYNSNHTFLITCYVSLYPTILKTKLVFFEEFQELRATCVNSCGSFRPSCKAYSRQSRPPSDSETRLQVWNGSGHRLRHHRPTQDQHIHWPKVWGHLTFLIFEVL